MYQVKKITNRNQIEQCEKFEIQHYMWNSTREPKAYGWMGYLEDEGFFVKMVCEESDPKRVYENHRDPVYEDSTMEVFLAFLKEGEELTNNCMYTNFEINSNGAMLANFGEGRANRQSITDEQFEQTGVKAVREENKWYLEVLYPESYLKEICDLERVKNGASFYCNFYKISESPEIIHFGSYSFIDNEKPNFHLPVFFAEAKIVEDKNICTEDVWVGRNEAAKAFGLADNMTSMTRFGSGHINDTFLVMLSEEGKAESRVILQKMNKSIFTKPVELMENVMAVTTFLRERIVEQGGDPERETLNIIPTTDGKPYFVDSLGEYWRCYVFIDGATCYDQVEDPNDFYESAVAFGNFQRLLADYPAETLHETIVGFHDTKARFEVFKKAVEADICGRADSVREEIEFVLSREEIANVFGDLIAKGEIPLRVTHNDTKLNNIMFDDKTHKGICVIDLDTVMPGLAMHDFGDSIRFGASTAAEDEKDLDKVWCSMELFDIYAKGFIEGCAGGLTQREIELLPMGAKVITFECGMRFLTDYLQGDTYFKIHRPGHNLDRCRTQFKLVRDMESKWDEMNAIIKKYNN